MNGPSVMLVERRLTHYRVPLLEHLRNALDDQGIRFRFVHGQPTPEEAKKNDEGRLPWAEPVANRYYLPVGNNRLCWQPLPADTGRADLIILNQENSLLSNYPFLFRPRGGRQRIAFFGHGANLQSSRPKGLRESFKRWTTNRVDWWFAYTGMSVGLVAAAGFPTERITNVENSVDTSRLREAIAGIPPEELLALQRQLDIEGCKVGLYLGSLYAEKRIDFLLAAADLLHASHPDFRLVIVGDGPMRNEVTRACESRPWCHWVGAQTGRNKAKYLALADVMLNPGLVGLGILDSFVAGAPLITTHVPLHSPEIDYLRPGINGLMVENSLASFVAASESVLFDDGYRSTLARGCLDASLHYTIDNMAKRFSEGIVSCLRA